MPTGNVTRVSSGKVLQLVADQLHIWQRHCRRTEQYNYYITEELTLEIQFVQKIINDAIFQGQFKSLNKTPHKVTKGGEDRNMYTTPSAIRAANTIFSIK